MSDDFHDEPAGADLAELEANLYAQIHHDAPDTVVQYSAVERLHQQTHGIQTRPAAPIPAQRFVSASSVVNRSASSASSSPLAGPPKRSRYWMDNSPIPGRVSYGPPVFTQPSVPVVTPSPTVAQPSSGSFVRPSEPRNGRHNKRNKKKGRSSPLPDRYSESDVPFHPLIEPTPVAFRTSSFTPYFSYMSHISSTLVSSIPKPVDAPLQSECQTNEPSALLATAVQQSPTAELPTPSKSSTQAQAQPAPGESLVTAQSTTRKSPSTVQPAVRKTPAPTQTPAVGRPNGRQVKRKAKKHTEHTAGQLLQLDRAREAQRLPNQRGTVPSIVKRAAEGKLVKVQQLAAKRDKASRVTLARNKRPVATINLDSDDGDNDDDDVICIPVSPPPLVCIESSDDESAQAPECEDDARTAIEPSDGTEDFVGRRDRNRLSNCYDDEASGENEPVELDEIFDSETEALTAASTATVYDALREQRLRINEGNAPATAQTPPPVRTAPVADVDVPVRPKSAPPAAAVRRPSLDDSLANQSYEVTENAFAAVDIYESESSDFPDSVYEKGRPVAFAASAAATKANDSDSDVSSIQLNTTNRAKRRHKRKTSESKATGSDYRSSEDEEADADDDDGDEDNEHASPNSSHDGPAFVDILRATSTPYLKRGAAVENAKSKPPRMPAVPPKRRRSVSGRLISSKATAAANGGAEQSDDEFMSMLSCIVHDSASTVADSSADISGGEPAIDARTIVENVLNKAAAKRKRDKTTGDGVEKQQQKEAAGEVAATGDTGDAGDCDAFVVDSVGSTEPDTGHAEPMDVADENGASAVLDADSPISTPIEGPEICWNEEMRCYYNESWGGEQWNKNELLQAMPRNRNEWKISDADLFPSAPQLTRRFRNARCHNCQETGHRAYECRLPTHLPSCHMCGQSGHREPRCPNTICLKCGSKTRVFNRTCGRCQTMANVICQLCNVKGHLNRDCPDKWRRYHSTTKANRPLTRQPPTKNALRYCCVCACAGHLAEQCRNALRILDQPAQSIRIRSYDESYQRIDEKHLNTDGSQLDHVSSYAFISAPKESYNFGWTVNESPDRIYGRFMDSVKFTRPVFDGNDDDQSKGESPSPVIEELVIDEATPKKKPRVIRGPGGQCLVLNPFRRKRNSANCTNGFTVDEASDLDVEPSSKTPSNMSDGNASQSEDVLPVNPFRLPSEDAATVERQRMMAVGVPSDDEIAQVMDRLDREACGIEVYPHKQRALANDTDEYDRLIEQQQRESCSGSGSLSQPAESLAPPAQASVAQQSLGSLPQALGSERHPPPPPPLLMDIVASAASVKRKHRVQSIGEDADIDLALVDEAIARHAGQSAQNVCSDNAGQQPAKRSWFGFANAPSPPPAPIIPGYLPANLCTNEKVAKETALPPQKRSKPSPASEAADDSAMGGYHVVLNEDIDSNTQAVADQPYAGDSDSNYSFSEYFVPQPAAETSHHKKSPLAANSASSAVAKEPVADFIPISSGDASADEAVQSDQHDDVNAELPDHISNQNCDAKIFLSKEHSKCLMNQHGTAFLSAANATYRVHVSMEWSSVGNIMRVKGSHDDQTRFHGDLLEFCTQAIKEQQRNSNSTNRLPKNRSTLIRFIKEHLVQLDRPSGNVRDLYHRMLSSDQQNNKAGTKQAERARRQLNMWLFGRAGLRDGSKHLDALQANLRELMNKQTCEAVPMIRRDEIFEHFRYIFSAHVHDDYYSIVREYDLMRRENRLPEMCLDRKLLGLKIQVVPVVGVLADVAFDEEVPLPGTRSTEPARQAIKAVAETVQLVETAQPVEIVGSNPMDSDDITFGNVVVPTNPAESADDPSMNDDHTFGSGENFADDLLLDAAKPDLPSNVNPSKLLWSAKALEFLDKCRQATTVRPNAYEMRRIKMVERRARDHLLTYTDYRCLLKMFDLITARP